MLNDPHHVEVQALPQQHPLQLGKDAKKMRKCNLVSWLPPAEEIEYTSHSLNSNAQIMEPPTPVHFDDDARSVQLEHRKHSLSLNAPSQYSKAASDAGRPTCKLTTRYRYSPSRLISPADSYPPALYSSPRSTPPLLNRQFHLSPHSRSEATHVCQDSARTKPGEGGSGIRVFGELRCD